VVRGGEDLIQTIDEEMRSRVTGGRMPQPIGLVAPLWEAPGVRGALAAEGYRGCLAGNGLAGKTRQQAGWECFHASGSIAGKGGPFTPRGLSKA